MALVATTVSKLTITLLRFHVDLVFLKSLADIVSHTDEAPKYERDRSASPRPARRNDSPRGGARRSASPGGNGYADR